MGTVNRMDDLLKKRKKIQNFLFNEQFEQKR